MQHYTLRIILLLFIFNSSACSPTTNDTNAIRLQSNADTSTIAIIMFDQIADWPFPKDYTPTNLTNNEVKTLDSVIRQYTKFYNDSLERNLGFSDKVDFQKFNYKRQYVPVINNKGEKEVWANFFCIEGERWRKQILIVVDGGNCFFNLKVNLSTKSCYDLSVNSDG